MRGSTIGVTLGIYIGSGIFTLIIVLGSMRVSAVTVDQTQLKEQKVRLLREADLDRLHHKIYAEVGEDRWEGTVKPDFLHKVTLHTIRSTGNILPEEGEILEWVRVHPNETRQLLAIHGNTPGDDMTPLLRVKYEDAPTLYEKK